MNLVTLATGVLALLGSALIGGVFFAFSSFIMKALARVPSSEGIAVMQSINVVVINPSFIGAFMGTALLSRWLAGIDLDGVPAYLETDNERNNGFYQRAGFFLDGEISVLGVPVWRMRRMPLAASAQ